MKISRAFECGRVGGEREGEWDTLVACLAGDINYYRLIESKNAKI